MLFFLIFKWGGGSTLPDVKPTLYADSFHSSIFNTCGKLRFSSYYAMNKGILIEPKRHVGSPLQHGFSVSMLHLAPLEGTAGGYTNIKNDNKQQKH